MGFFDRVKEVFSTGQASAVDVARQLYASNDLEGAVNCLKEALFKREETGKALAVIREHHDIYLEEYHQKRLTEHRCTLSITPFDASNCSLIEGILTSIEKGLKEGDYSGKTRSEAEGLYKEYQEQFQALREKALKEDHKKIIRRLNGMDPESNADGFVTLVEELRRIGGRLPQTMYSNHQIAQKRFYVLPNNLKEFDNYLIERRLGSGGFASVFLASPKGVSFRTAIKIFSPQPNLVHESGLSLTELKERFRREASIMLRLSAERSPGVVNAQHTDVWRGKPYLTMNYYPKNLSALVGSDEELLRTGRGGYISYDKALPIISEILTSIHWLHNRSVPVVHRDLKPENILLDNDNRSYIGDFGLAREVSRADLLTRAFKTVTGTNLATQYYGAPEQRGGLKEADQRADVFSLGIMIYRILTGRLIGFHDLEPIELYVKGLGKDTTGKINDLLNKATKIEVGQRLTDVSNLLKVFSSKQTAVQINSAPQLGPTPEDQFLTALELAFTFAPNGEFPENVRATLNTKIMQVGLDFDKAKIMEKDFRFNLALSQNKDPRVVSVAATNALKTVEGKGVGTLIITSEPEMATVLLDGFEHGSTPLSIDRVSTGRRAIYLKKNGFFPVSRIERIIPEEETRIHVILEYQTGKINVFAKTFSDAYPARLFLDGKLMGRPPLTVEDLKVGTYTYRIEADNHQAVTGEVLVSLDKEAKLDVSLEPMPGSVILHSKTSGSTIWVDGERSNLKIDVKAKIALGKHNITFKHDLYVDAEREIEALPGIVLEEEFHLLRSSGRINVVSIPEGASIWLDGEDTGKKTDHLMEVLAGEHEISLKLDGCKDVTKRVQLDPEGFVEIELRIEKWATFNEPITGMEFVFVQSGKFMMGDVFGDGNGDEKPVHEVELAGFYIGKYPVTQEEWEAIMGGNPSDFNDGNDYPVECVSWDSVQAFLQALSSRNKWRYQFRLPTEAEWEYAARTGGKEEKYSGGHDADAVAWYDENSGGTTHPVGEKLPNGLGIYDMSGNVSEWCQDWYQDWYRSPSSGSKRVVRGGSCFSSARDCRSTNRRGFTPGRGGTDLGFRVVRKL